MKLYRLASVVSVFVALLCTSPAIAQDQSSLEGAARTVDLRKADDSESKRAEEKERRKEESKAEADKQNKGDQNKAGDEEKKDEGSKGTDQKDTGGKADEVRKEQPREGVEIKVDTRSKEEERRLEKEARREAEKRERVERRREHHDYYGTGAHPSDNTYYPPSHDDTVIILTPDSPAGGSSGTTAPASYSQPSTQYRVDELPRAYASLLFAPGDGERKAAVGVQYLSTRRIGACVWYSGPLGDDGDVIDATIPHNDYYVDSRNVTYGAEALLGVGSDAAMIIFGAGVSVEKTTYTDVSNATGWRWKGGESTEVKPAAQVSLRLRVGGRVSIQAGYDTAQSAFFGLAASF